MNHCGCNDWQSTHRRSMLRRQGQVVPIPRAVLQGESAGMCRRDFLRNGAVAFLTVYGASMLDWGHIWEAASAQAATPGTDPIIVSVFLDGGNDGLNTLIPITGSDYAAYASKRPHIGLAPANCLPLGGAAANPDWALEPGRDRVPAAVRRRQDRGHPVGRLHAARPLALPLARLLAGRRARSRPRHRLAGPLGRPERRCRQPAAGGLGRLVAGRVAEERDQPGRGAVERRGRPVLDEQRVVGSAADGGHAGRPVRAQRRERGHGALRTTRSAARSTWPTG